MKFRSGLILSIMFASLVGGNLANAEQCRSLFKFVSFEGMDHFLRDREVIVLIDAGASRKVLSRAKIVHEFTNGENTRIDVTADTGSMKTFDKFYAYKPVRQRFVRAHIYDLGIVNRAAKFQEKVLIVAGRGHAPKLQYVGLLPNGTLVEVLEIFEEWP